MTTFTRRDALMLTAAVAAASAAPQPAAAANPDPAELDVPLDIVGGSSIPIAIKIAQKAVDPAKLQAVDVSVQLQQATDDKGDKFAPIPVFDATFTDEAIIGTGIALMTRLKVPFREYLTKQQTFSQFIKEQKDKGVDKIQSPSQFKIDVAVTTTLTEKGGKVTKSDTPTLKTMTIKKEDCDAAEIAVLRLALQPSSTLKAKDQVTLKAVVPAPPSSRKLTMIDCQNTSDKTTTPFKLSVSKDPGGAFLSDEVFVGFNLYPDKAGPDLLTMTWTYQDVPPAGLPAAAPAGPAPAAPAPGPPPVSNSKLIASAYVLVEASS